jgi:glycosyltransferase involved in cell wall biosynthesis
MTDISVVIPSYNSEKYIEETIQSVLKQTLTNIEIIVIDDGSTDRSADIVKSYTPLVRLIQQTNAGVSFARNRGIQEARGQYICFIDSDDYWLPDKLEKQLNAFHNHPETGAVFSDFIRWNEGELNTFPSVDDLDLSAHQEGIDPNFSGWIFHLFLLDCWMLTSSAMIRKEVFLKCGLFNTNLPCGEDWDLWLRISREYPFIKLREPTTLYRQHKEQTTSRVRDIDYRTTILTQAAQRWGLCSRDGRCISQREFLNQLSKYHAIFARTHEERGRLPIAIRSYFNAWLCSKANILYLLNIPLAIIKRTITP